MSGEEAPDILAMSDSELLEALGAAHVECQNGPRGTPEAHALVRRIVDLRGEGKRRMAAAHGVEVRQALAVCEASADEEAEAWRLAQLAATLIGGGYTAETEQAIGKAADVMAEARLAAKLLAKGERS